MIGEKQIRRPAESRYEKELKALEAADGSNRKPAGWKLSPRAVRDFILGRREPLLLNGEEVRIQKKYLGNDALVERCIITLAGNRGARPRPCCRSCSPRPSAASAPTPSRELPEPRRT